MKNILVTHADKVGAFLRDHLGFYFCSFCLSRELSFDPLIARNAVWELQASPSYEMRTTRCVACGRAKRVIASLGGFALLGPEAHVVAFLLDNKGLALCNVCLAFGNELSLADAQRVADYLQPLPEFHRLATGPCSVCTRTTKPIISARVTDGEPPAGDDHDGFASVGSSTVQYRGWRVDVLSYRVAAGWRPFIVIHGPEKAVVPEAVTWCDTVPTKAEADARSCGRRD